MLEHRLSRKKNILIVESDDVLAKWLQATIAQKTQYCAVRVSTGERALTVLSTIIPDLLIINTQMADTTGAQLIAHIQSAEKLNPLPLLLLGTDRPIERGLSLSLPLSSDVFLQTLAYLLTA